MTLTLSIQLYLLVQLALGAYVSKKIASENDYFLAGRSLGLGLATFSIFATWFGAETCMGSAAAIYKNGLSGSRADPFGYTVCLLLVGLLIAMPLWKKNLTTLADFYKIRYSPAIEKLSVWIMLPTSLFWAAAQIRAFGQIFATTTHFSIEICVTIAALVVITYTAFGGLMSDVVTDLLQGLILIVGLVGMLVVMVSHLGGPVAAVQMIDPAKLRFVAPGESLWERLDTWAIPILGSLVAQEVLQRVFASRNPQVARKASLLAGFIYLLVGLIPVAFGLLGTQFPLTLSDPDQFLPTLAKQILPTFLFIVFSGALISAILSTVDSALLASGALLSHNFICTFFKDISEAGKVKMARLLVVASGLFAYGVALHGSSIYDLLQVTSSFGTAGILVITLFGLFTKWGGTKAAGLALITGLITTPLAEYVLELKAPFITSIVASMFVYAVAGSFEFVRSQLNPCPQQERS